MPPRSQHFFGRKNLITDILSKLSSTEEQRVALTGLGGVGKSQLALRVAEHFCQSQMMSILWLDASNALSLEQSYLRIASHFRLPEDANVHDIHNFLDSDTSDGAVLVFDALDDLGETPLEQIHRYLPGSGSKLPVIFTSRNGDCVDELVAIECTFPIHSMEKDEAEEFLRKRSNDISALKINIEALSEALNWFPLAIEQAGAFMQTRRTSIASYLRLYTESSDKQYRLLDYFSKSKDRSNFSRSVTCTWKISFERIEAECPLAVQLLRYMSGLSCCQIPRDILLPVEDDLEFIQAMGLLQAYSMIQADSDYQYFTMHPLVHLITRNQSSSLQDDRQQASALVLQCMPSEFNNQADILAGDKLIPHAEHVLPHTNISKAELALRMSRFLQVKGIYHKAFDYAKLAVSEAEKSTTDINMQGLLERSQLAWVHRCLGNTVKAYSILYEILASSEKTLGTKNPHTLGIMHDTAIILRDCHKYTEAESLSLRVLELTEETMGTENDKFLRRLLNYSESLLCQKKYQQAESQYRRAVKQAVQLHGPSSLTTLSSMSSLGVALHEQKKWVEAIEWHTQALEGRTEILGPNHHHTLKSKANLTIVHQGQRRFEEAETAMREILNSYELTLGVDHPDTLSVKYNLAIVLHHQNKLEETLEVIEQVYEVAKLKLGVEHQFTTNSRVYFEGLRTNLQTLLQISVVEGSRL
jgi:tetratricopeptide (TPR) repeat protein